MADCDDDAIRTYKNPLTSYICGWKPWFTFISAQTNEHRPIVMPVAQCQSSGHGQRVGSPWSNGVLEENEGHTRHNT